MPSAQTQTAKLKILRLVFGALAGVLVGVFFGEDCLLLRPIGSLYVMLLEVAVYPYLICSLLHGLGSMQPGQAHRLFRAAWPFFLGLWILTYAWIYLLGMALPIRHPTGITPEPTTLSAVDVLSMLIPSDPFAALSKNYVPAVVLFCILFGLALQHVKEKSALLACLDNFRNASLVFWNGVVRFAPIAVFALFAVTAGTTRLSNLEALGIYLFLLFAGVGILSFWVLPALIGALTPMPMREVLPRIRDGITLALVTSLSVAALPYITEATKKVAERCGVPETLERDDLIRTNLAVAYPLGQLGNFMVCLFLLFAFSYYQQQPTTAQALLLPPISLVSLVGSPSTTVDSVAFLSTWLGLPENTQPLYVEMMTLTRYGQVLLSVLGFAFLSFTVVLGFFGKLRIRLLPLIGTLVVSALLGFGLVAGINTARHHWGGQTPNPYLKFSLSPDLLAGAHFTVVRPGTSMPALADIEGTVFDRIQETGKLRVGYNPGVIPFCYFNENGDLSGYDVAVALALAKDLNVTVTFIPFQWSELQTALIANKFDLAIGGIYVTEERLRQLEVSAPYYRSPFALFMPRERVKHFMDREAIASQKGLKLGVFNDPVLVPRLRQIFPDANLVIVDDYSTLPDFTKIDAAFWTLEQAEALAASHPNLVAVQPRDLGSPLLFAYLMPPGNSEFRSFLNYWLQLKRTSGFQTAEENYWLKRIPREPQEPRWSILRNVILKPGGN